MLVAVKPQGVFEPWGRRQFLDLDVAKRDLPILEASVPQVNDSFGRWKVSIPKEHHLFAVDQDLGGSGAAVVLGDYLQNEPLVESGLVGDGGMILSFELAGDVQIHFGAHHARLGHALH
jgi:hypothetical protein